MNIYPIDKTILKILRHLYLKMSGTQIKMKPLDRETDFQKSSDIIYEALLKNVPCMISRFGAVEISALANYHGINSKKRSVINYIKGLQYEWWWNEGIRTCMMDNAGFFPNTDESLTRFCELMLADMKEIDILASWQNQERLFVDLFPNAKCISYTSFDCYWNAYPWTRILENKKVLVVHPFSEEIEYQYINNRTKLFKNPLILPKFELITLKSVQSIGGNNNFETWFDALDFMKKQIDLIDYDICLLGCGAYGMPLAAHVKRRGKMAVHIGGSLQLLFGIRGKRWEDPNYGINIHGEAGLYASLFNESWIRPKNASRVKNLEKVDDGCYW